MVGALGTVVSTTLKAGSKAIGTAGKQIKKTTKTSAKKSNASTSPSKILEQQAAQTQQRVAAQQQAARVAQQQQAARVAQQQAVAQQQQAVALAQRAQQQAAQRATAAQKLQAARAAAQQQRAAAKPQTVVTGAKVNSGSTGAKSAVSARNASKVERVAEPVGNRPAAGARPALTERTSVTQRIGTAWNSLSSKAKAGIGALATGAAFTGGSLAVSYIADQMTKQEDPYREDPSLFEQRGDVLSGNLPASSGLLGGLTDGGILPTGWDYSQDGLFGPTYTDPNGYTYVNPVDDTGINWVDDILDDGGYLVYDESGDPIGVCDANGNFTGLTDSEAEAVEKALTPNWGILIGSVVLLASGLMVIRYKYPQIKERLRHAKRSVKAGTSKKTTSTYSKKNTNKGGLLL